MYIYFLLSYFWALLFSLCDLWIPELSCYFLYFCAILLSGTEAVLEKGEFSTNWVQRAKKWLKRLDSTILIAAVHTDCVILQDEFVLFMIF